MSAPQSVQKMVNKSNQLGGQGSTQHPKFNASFYRSKCLVAPFRQAKTKIKMGYAFRPLYDNQS